MPGNYAILGASGTIGATLSRQLTLAGHKVLMLGRDSGKLAALGQEIGQSWKAVNLDNSQELEDVLRHHAEQSGPWSGMANCIGSLILKPAHLTSDEEFRQTVETNLFSSFALVRAAGKLMREGGGSVVLVASAAAEIGISNHEAIAAAKGGVISLARSAAATYAPQQIRVNVVSPGLTRTELTRRIWSNPASAAASQEMHALGKLGEPADVANLIAWLLDPTNSFITGQVIGVDGGLGHVLARKK
ncbi:MAG: SDR family oxidoreductase [Pirellulales bacterium]|nr:SDR family oxidoreductase [Pirellulales bacterium]